MKALKVLTEKWFTNAPFHEVKMLGIKHLNIPASSFEDTNKPENSKRALVRQVFNKSDHKYGDEFEIIESSNPFGTPSKRRTVVGGKTLEGDYRFVKNGLRAAEGDIRWQMMSLMEKHTKFEELIKDWEHTSGTGAKEIFKNSGEKGKFNFIDMVDWAIKRGWIVRV